MDFANKIIDWCSNVIHENWGIIVFVAVTALVIWGIYVLLEDNQ